MLVLEDGSQFGSVSSGCLEQDILERCRCIFQELNSGLENDSEIWKTFADSKNKMLSDRQLLLSYQSSYDADEPFGLNSGCPGRIEILLELLDQSRASNRISVIEEGLRSCTEGRTSFVGVMLDTAAAFAGLRGCRILALRQNPSEPMQLYLYENCRRSSLSTRLEELYGKEFAGSFSLQIQKAFAELDLQNRHTASFYLKLSTHEGELNLFLEKLSLPQQVVIFGANYGSKCLAGLAVLAGFEVTVCDYRRLRLLGSEFPESASLHLFRPEDAASLPDLSAFSAVVLMTHNFQADKQILEALVKTRLNQCRNESTCKDASDFALAYLGILGPKLRSERILQQLEESGLCLPTDLFDKVYAPAGLDTGAEGEEQIAVSILAEIQAVLNGRSGGFLRQRLKPIYEAQVNLLASLETKARPLPLILLAAGQSKRLGRPKQLLQTSDGKSLLELLVRAGAESGCSDLIVVLGAYKEELAPKLAGFNLHIVENKDWQSGMASSIAAGLNFVQNEFPEAEAVLISVVDQPFITAGCFDLLIRAFREKKARIVAAKYADRFAVPAVFASEYFSELASLTGDQGARSLLSSKSSQVCGIEIPEAAFDIDSQEDWDSYLNLQSKNCQARAEANSISN